MVAAGPGAAASKGEAMAWDIIGSYLGKKAVDKMPMLVARRVAPPQKVRTQVEIDSWRECPVTITLGGAVPTLDLTFRIDNRSHVDLTLDRLLIEFWATQPILYEAVMHRYWIGKQGHREDIRFRKTLDPY